MSDKFIIDTSFFCRVEMKIMLIYFVYIIKQIYENL